MAPSEKMVLDFWNWAGNSSSQNHSQWYPDSTDVTRLQYMTRLLHTSASIYIPLSRRHHHINIDDQPTTHIHCCFPPVSLPLGTQGWGWPWCRSLISVFFLVFPHLVCTTSSTNCLYSLCILLSFSSFPPLSGHLLPLPTVLLLLPSTCPAHFSQLLTSFLLFSIKGTPTSITNSSILHYQFSSVLQFFYQVVFTNLHLLFVVLCLFSCYLYAGVTYLSFKLPWCNTFLGLTVNLQAPQFS